MTEQMQKPHEARIIQSIERLIGTLEEFRDDFKSHLPPDYEPLPPAKGTRLRRCLQRANVETYGELRELTPERFLAFKDCGLTTWHQAREYAAELQIYLEA